MMGAVGSSGPISPASVPLRDLALITLVLEQFKSQGLFDTFCQDCLAQMDNKPAYQNWRQKVDNFVSVVQSGMLEAGVDRILSEVVDPKLNHIFWPQTERAIHEFLAAQKKAAVPAPTPEPGSQDPPAPSQKASQEYICHILEAPLN
ncbi:hypothetical protein FD755_018268 [Muntiacus reevesi]|uniref:BOD1/SHG1 domain-containing protein n=1 Tax=Muntiacus reevesi TaxID=9886 RepID=A0A5N3XAV3_MUNRE|nr:hypothetical protein FD755_018268 [Muntiacus reevesi]